MHKVEIELNVATARNGSLGKVLIDGQEIRASRIYYEASVDSIPRIVLEVPALYTTINGDADVQVVENMEDY